MITLQKATQIVRDYFRDQCQNERSVYTFRVNGAISDEAKGYYIIWSTHSCMLSDQHHRVAVDQKTGGIVAIQRRDTANAD